MTCSKIKLLFFIAIIAVSNISLSLCYENNYSTPKKVEPEDILPDAGSRENIIKGAYPPFQHYMDSNGKQTVRCIDTNLSAFSGSPSYKLGIQASNINEDDYLTIDLWITGMGGVDAAKMSIKIPSYLVDNESIDLIRHDYHYEFYPNETVLIKPIIILDKLSGTNIIRNIPLSIFYPQVGKDDNKTTTAICGELIIPEKTIKNGDAETFPPNWTYELPKGAGKVFYYNKIIFKKSKNAPPGDHDIKFDLFYKGQGKWYVDSQSLPLHVNYIYERKDVQHAIIIFAIIGIICQLDALISRPFMQFLYI